MNAAVTRSSYKKEDLDKLIKQYRETVLPVAGTPGGPRSAMLLVDRQTGDAISIAYYEDEASAKAFGPNAQKLLETFKQFQLSEAKREIFEISASTQQEAKAVVERGVKAFNAHDAEAMARDAAPDIEGSAPGDIKLKGPQAVKEYNQIFLTAFPDARAEAKKIVAQGNNVVVHGVFTGTHNGTLKTPMGDIPATGKKVKGDYVQVFEVDRGLIKKGDLIYDQVQLMTQLGFAPAPPQRTAPAGR